MFFKNKCGGYFGNKLFDNFDPEDETLKTSMVMNFVSGKLTFANL